MCEALRVRVTGQREGCGWSARLEDTACSLLNTAANLPTTTHTHTGVASCYLVSVCYRSVSVCVTNVSQSETATVLTGVSPEVAQQWFYFFATLPLAVKTTPTVASNNNKYNNTAATLKNKK